MGLAERKDEGTCTVSPVWSDTLQEMSLPRFQIPTALLGGAG